MTPQISNIRLSLQRVVDGIYTKDDVYVISVFLKEQGDTFPFDESIKQVWAESMELVDDDAYQHALYKVEAEKLLNKIQNKKKRLFVFSPLMKVAAVAALFFSIGWGGYKVFESDFFVTDTYVELHVSNGSKKHVVLADGTKVILNAGSTLRYPTHFRGNERNIALEGEAFFDVTKNKAKPFIIHTHEMTVKVLGTSFNVKSYKADEQVSVNVVTGKVKVDMQEAMLVLLPNEKMVLNKSTGGIERKTNCESHLNGWLTGDLYFDHTPIKSVANELSRNYNCEIVFAKGAKYEDLISGEHDNKCLESVLQSIKMSTGINYKREGNKIILYKEIAN